MGIRLGMITPSLNTVLEPVRTPFGYHIIEVQERWGADSALLFTFSAIRRQFVASETVRQRLKLEDRAVGDVVYSSADTAGEESERDQAAFDRDRCVLRRNRRCQNRSAGQRSERP